MCFFPPLCRKRSLSAGKLTERLDNLLHHHLHHLHKSTFSKQHTYIHTLYICICYSFIIMYYTFSLFIISIIHNFLDIHSPSSPLAKVLKPLFGLCIKTQYISLFTLCSLLSFATICLSDVQMPKKKLSHRALAAKRRWEMQAVSFRFRTKDFVACEYFTASVVFPFLSVDSKRMENMDS